MENVDLWMEIQEALEERTAETFWVKVPSHVDIEGNEQADALAKKGVEKHGVKLKGEEIQAREPGNRKRKMQEEQKEEEERWSRGCRKKFPEEKAEYMPSGKRTKQSSVQILLDLGPLLPVVIQRIPKRVLQITYVDLDRQLEDEGQRRQQVRLEEQMRATVEVEFLKNLLDLYVRFEKLQRWTLLVLDRRHRHALRVMGQVQWAEVHLRERAVQQESLERDHLFEFLILAQERAGRRLLRGMQGLEWANLLSTARVQRDMIAL